MRNLIVTLLSLLFAACKNEGLKTTVVDNQKDVESKYQIIINGSCSYIGELSSNSVYGFTSDQAAKEGLNNTMKFTGLPANFTIMAADVDNACAVIKTKNNGNAERYIMYNQEFMLAVRDRTQNHWAEISILAHEIGHHLSGPTLIVEPNRPDLELEADQFSGYVLYKMGASLSDAQVAMKTFSTENGSSTHPGKKARLAAITNGWISAKEQSGNKEKEKTEESQVDPDGINAEELNDEQELRIVVDKWILSIEEKDIESFASYLSADYSYESSDGVKRNFETRINKLRQIFSTNTYIDIDYSIASIRKVDDEAVVISYYQTYKSEKFNDSGYKYLYLTKKFGEWKITRESFFK